MLHGEIKVNNIVIGEWRAVRKNELNGFCDYACVVTYRDLKGYPMFAEFWVRGHAESNGAISLAARVMHEAMQHLKYVNKSLEEL